MNGEISQMCRLTAAARAAIRDNSEFEFTLLKYEGSICFDFCDRNGGAMTLRITSPQEWFNRLKSQGISNIFMICGLNVNPRISGFINNSNTSIFVRYSDNIVTKFEPNWSFDDENRVWNITYTEKLIKNAPEKDPEFRDESSLLEVSLKDMAKLADKLGQDMFASVFRKAEGILTGEVTPKLKEGAVLPKIPQDRVNIYLASDTADVFGTMGSWNDEPLSKAIIEGVEKDYNTLSARLITSLRLMAMYAVNFPF